MMHNFVKIDLSSALRQIQTLSFCINIRTITNTNNVSQKKIALAYFQRNACHFIHLSAIQVFSNDPYQGIKGRLKRGQGEFRQAQLQAAEKITFVKSFDQHFSPSLKVTDDGVSERCHAKFFQSKLPSNSIMKTN